MVLNRIWCRTGYKVENRSIYIVYISWYICYTLIYIYIYIYIVEIVHDVFNWLAQVQEDHSRLKPNLSSCMQRSDASQCLRLHLDRFRKSCLVGLVQYKYCLVKRRVWTERKLRAQEPHLRTELPSPVHPCYTVWMSEFVEACLVCDLTLTDYVLYTAIQVSGTQYIEKGSSIQLVCNVTGKPDPPNSIDWYRGNNRVNSDTHNGIIITKKIETRVMVSMLVIKNSQPEDSGEYVCRSSDRESSSIKVHVLNGESPGFIIYKCCMRWRMCWFDVLTALIVCWLCMTVLICVGLGWFALTALLGWLHYCVDCVTGLIALTACVTVLTALLCWLLNWVGWFALTTLRRWLRYCIDCVIISSFALNCVTALTACVLTA